VDRGWVYRQLTDRPDNRRPLTWERNQVDLLLLEGRAFVCPWTERLLTRPGEYDLDHLVPLAVYPVNELWNLVPADAHFNTRVKRDRLPSPERVARATPHLARAYRHYATSPALARALREDVATRFAGVRENGGYPDAVAAAAAGFLERIAAARNLARF
jgi:HNH endonuclease